MFGVLVAPYALPTDPVSSRRIGLGIDQLLAASPFIAASAPCLPAEPLLTASQTTPSFMWRLAVSTSEPTVCDRLTNGQPGLNHSSTTTLPLNEASLTSLPVRSFKVKSGAVLPITGEVASDRSARLGEPANASAATVSRAVVIRMAGLYTGPSDRAPRLRGRASHRLRAPGVTTRDTHGTLRI